MKKSFLFAALLFLIGGFVLGLSACSPSSTGTTSAPVIVAFTASPTEITSGSSATLMWNVTNATSIQIDQGVGSGLAVAGTTSVSPGSTTTYTLTASNSTGSVQQSVTVTVTSSTTTPTSSRSISQSKVDLYSSISPSKTYSAGPASNTRLSSRQ